VPAPIVTDVTPAEFPSVVERVRALDAAVCADTGHEALGDAVWRDLADPDTDSLGLLVDDRAYAHVARSDNFSSQHWAIGLALTAAAHTSDTVCALLDAAARHIAAHGGGRMLCWVFDAQPADDELLDAAGFRPARDLYEMRVPLPLAETPAWPAGIQVRDFEPGRDDAAWLQVNNRAFANHPEQGAWIESTLRRRLAEDWFDPSLFVLAFDDHGLAGFNWCKLHAATSTEPVLGEIWVIGVDPRVAGSGLGRPLAIEGLARMHARGAGTGSLFTDADNERALKLYKALGFTVHRTDRSYAREVEAA
jgi:mycothiol synthase